MTYRDQDTRVQELKNAVKKFREDRDWTQFHTPLNLAMDLSVEASELLELFLWKDAHESTNRIKNNPLFREKIEEELADVFHAALSFADIVGIDVTTILTSKLEKTGLKYPVDEWKGRSGKQ